MEDMMKMDDMMMNKMMMMKMDDMMMNRMCDKDEMMKVMEESK
ncbi:hypothetical protein [Bacillus toyonensis]|nr:hypothetical protein [Bacillus toyonensis]